MNIFGAKIDVLDHGFVRLVDFMGSDLSIVRAARVSYNAEWRAGEDEGSDERLINYLWRNAHTSPFEHVTITFEVKAPIFVFRQWHRHRTWSFNEVSGRYAELPEEFYVPKPEHVGKQSKGNKQARDFLDTSSGLRPVQCFVYRQACLDAFKKYRDLLQCGWPRELARAILPVSTYSHMFATVNLLNLMKFLTLRCHEHSQYEIRKYACAMKVIAQHVAPVAMRAWETGCQE
jgi:thymidylate synthase (FAD)